MLDGGFRWNDTFDLSAYIIRGGMGYQISPKTRLAGGFAHMGTMTTGQRISRHEYRPFQELSLRGAWGKTKLTHRFRVEERIFESRLAESESTSFNFRFRYAIMLGIPLANLSQKHPERKLVLNLGDEILLNAGQEHAYQTFDQNRVIISPTLHLNESLSIALTYNSQFASTTVPDAYLYSHVIWIQTRYNLDLRKTTD